MTWQKIRELQSSLVILAWYQSSYLGLVSVLLSWLGRVLLSRATTVFEAENASRRLTWKWNGHEWCKENIHVCIQKVDQENTTICVRLTFRYMWNGCDGGAKYNSVLLYHKKDWVGLGVLGVVYMYTYMPAPKQTTQNKQSCGFTIQDMVLITIGVVHFSLWSDVGVLFHTGTALARST